MKLVEVKSVPGRIRRRTVHAFQQEKPALTLCGMAEPRGSLVTYYDGEPREVNCVGCQQAALDLVAF